MLFGRIDWSTSANAPSFEGPHIFSGIKLSSDHDCHSDWLVSQARKPRTLHTLHILYHFYLWSPVSAKNVLKESSGLSKESGSSKDADDEGISPFGRIPCSRQKSSQQAFPSWQPPWPTCGTNNDCDVIPCDCFTRDKRILPAAIMCRGNLTKLEKTQCMHKHKRKRKFKKRRENTCIWLILGLLGCGY
jgi:hypothetical protein